MKEILSLCVAVAAVCSLTAKDTVDNPYAMCYHITFFGDSENDSAAIRQDLDLQKAIGITTIRSDFNWDWIGKDSEGNYDFIGWAKKIMILDEKEMLLLPILNNPPMKMRPMHEYLPEWADFTAQVVRFFGDKLPYWEVINEHNFTNETQWGTKDPIEHAKNYTAVLKSTYEAVKGVDPKLVVLYGGTGHVPLEYIEKTLKNDAGKYFDIMNVHPYSWGQLPEDFLKNQIIRLKKVMKKYDCEKPIWVTEIGWSTAPQKETKFYRQVLPIAFDEIGINPKDVPLVFLDDVNNPIYNMAKAFPAFQKVISWPIEKLKDLDPKKYPVLVPCREEIFPNYYVNDLVDYVRRGGTVILPQGIPLSWETKVYDDDSNELVAPKVDGLKALHIDLRCSWNGYPETTEVEIPGVPTEEIAQFKNFRFLFNSRLEGNDQFTPLAYGVKKDIGGEDEYLPIAAVYKYDSDLKGNAIVIAQRDDVIQAMTTEKLQSEILPRTHLILFAEGVERVFWYSLISGDPESNDREANFGIMTRERTPKPAYTAYKTLSKAFTPGSTIPTIAKSDDNVYTAKWKRPDGKTVYAVWTPQGVESASLESGIEVEEVYDHLGNIQNVNHLKFKASPSVLYFVCK